MYLYVLQIHNRNKIFTKLQCNCVDTWSSWRWKITLMVIKKAPLTFLSLLIWLDLNYFCSKEFYEKVRLRNSLANFFKAKGLFRPLPYQEIIIIKKNPTIKLLYSEMELRKSVQNVIPVYYISLWGKWDLNNLGCLFKMVLHNCIMVWGLYRK